MAHDLKLSVYTIKLKTVNREVEKTNRCLFKYITGNPQDSESEDGFLFLEMCKKFISAIDTDRMFSDENTKKSMTANQVDIESSDVNPSIKFHSDSFIIEGLIEGGAYGKKRKKTSTIDKKIKSDVQEGDAITDDFYFFINTPLHSDKSILLIQSYTDDNIDSVMKKFWHNFFQYPSTFSQPAIVKFIPKTIIDEYKDGATISNLTYTTEVPSSSLLESSIGYNSNRFKITVKIEPVESGFTYDEFDKIIEPIENTKFKNFPLKFFKRKKGALRDNRTGKSTPFVLENEFKIKPIILLSKYIEIRNDSSDFDRIREYCFAILKDLKQEIYAENAVEER